MAAVTCPACRRMFVITESSWEDGEDAGRPDTLTCPFCLRWFDPFASSEERRGSRESAGLDELVERRDRDDDDAR